jgi:hypothetical protein
VTSVVTSASGASTATTSTPAASVTTGQAASSGSGGTACEVTEIFLDPACNACALASCCEEAEDCIADFEDCLDDDGGLDPTSRRGAALAACVANGCAEVCGTDPGTGVGDLCDTGLNFGVGQTGDAAFTACFNDLCCEALDICLGWGFITCGQCLDGEAEQALCASVDACARESCGSPLANVPVCGTDYRVAGFDLADCMESSCCEQVLDCVSFGPSGGDGCNECIADGGGPRCNELIACQAGCG